VDYGEILGSDSEFEDDMYYGKDDGMYADHLLKEFADRLYRNFNGPGRVMRKGRGSSSWEGKYACHVTVRLWSLWLSSQSGLGQGMGLLCSPDCTLLQQVNHSDLIGSYAKLLG